MTTDLEVVPNEEAFALAVLRAEQALAEADSLIDVVRIRNEAEALRTYADSAKYGLRAQNSVAAFRLKAERKAGEMLAALGREQGGEGRFHQAGTVPPPMVRTVSEYARAISELQMSPTTARRWQQEARIAESDFRRYIATADAEISTKGLLRLLPKKESVRREVEETPARRVDMSRAATEARRERIREMAEAGHSVTDIAQSVGVGPTVVAEVAHAAGITLVHERIGKARRIEVNRVVEGIVESAVPARPALALLEGHWSELDESRLQGWVDSLSSSIYALTRLRNNLRGELDGRSSGAPAAEVAPAMGATGRPDRDGEEPAGVSAGARGEARG